VSFTVKARETWRMGDEFSVDVHALTEEGGRLFFPGAQVIVDRHPSKGNKLEVNVKWGSSGSRSTLEDARAQLECLTTALKIADGDLEALEAVVVKWPRVSSWRRPDPARRPMPSRSGAPPLRRSRTSTKPW
jgi:hypothetical protein